MIRALVHTYDAGPVFIVGLTAEEQATLKAGKSVHTDLRPLGGNGNLMIVTGQDEQSIKKSLEDYFDDDTPLQMMWG